MGALVAVLVVFGAPRERPVAAASVALLPAAPPPRYRDRAGEGRALFYRHCVGCHGLDGRGGVVNRNYLTDTVPRVDTLAGRMMLLEPEDVGFVVRMLERGEAPEPGLTDPPFRTWRVFVAQYEAVHELVRKGNPAGRKDAHGPKPPLDMPSWEGRLDRPQVDAIIVYLLTEFPWDEDLEEDDYDDEEDLD